MNQTYIFYLCIAFLLFACACGDKSKKTQETPLSIEEKQPDIGEPAPRTRGEKADTASTTSNVYTFPYDFSAPTDKKKLPKELTEISGLDHLATSLYACIQDEKANIYVYNWETDEITSKIDFGKNGDFEDLEVVGTEIWALRSDGDLYQIQKFNSPDQTTEKYENHLNDSNDVEGLSLDANKKNLLLACKGMGGKDPDSKNYKSVYAFNLASKTLSENPIFSVSLEEIANRINQDKNLRAYNKLAEFFNPESGNVTFQPSGIDIHPTSKNIYLIASAGKLLVVLDPNGKNIIHLQPLDSDVFKQPEGICFMKNGDLLISNEGRDGKANILKFSPNN